MDGWTDGRQTKKNLIEKIGEVGGRIHLGRSRNDQVLTALRLYYLDAIDEIIISAEKLCEEIRVLDGRQGSIKLPGTTHMQHAMMDDDDEWSCRSDIGSFLTLAASSLCTRFTNSSV